MTFDNTKGELKSHVNDTVSSTTLNIDGEALLTDCLQAENTHVQSAHSCHLSTCDTLAMAMK